MSSSFSKDAIAPFVAVAVAFPLEVEFPTVEKILSAALARAAAADGSTLVEAVETGESEAEESAAKMWEESFSRARRSGEGEEEGESLVFAGDGTSQGGRRHCTCCSQAATGRGESEPLGVSRSWRNKAPVRRSRGLGRSKRACGSQSTGQTGSEASSRKGEQSVGNQNEVEANRYIRTVSSPSLVSLSLLVLVDVPAPSTRFNPSSRFDGRGRTKITHSDPASPRSRPSFSSSLVCPPPASAVLQTIARAHRAPLCK